MMKLKLQHQKDARAGLGSIEATRREEIISKTVTKTEGTLYHQLTDGYISAMEARLYDKPNSTADLRCTDVYYTPYTLGKVPLSGLTNDIPECELEKEIFARYTIPFTPFPGRGNKRTHPLHKVINLAWMPFKKISWTDKKDLLMVDKEC